jgi:PAS domain S-box-containing protein
MAPMNPRNASRHSERVLIHAPFGRDGVMIAGVLEQAGVEASVCGEPGQLISELSAGVGALLIADEALNAEFVETLSERFREQPNWSDLPVLVLTSGGEATMASRHRLKLLEPLGNYTLLERPLRIATLLSTVQTALRARRRQYEIADFLEEREELLVKLRASERTYRGIGESIDYGIWVCDPQGRNIYASESFLKLVGKTQQEFADFGWGDTLHPDDAGPTIAAWKEFVASGRFWDRIVRFRGVDGKYHPILARGVPIRSDAGEILCWAGINLDVSREREAEVALQESNEALRRSNSDLEQFAYAASHDLQEPLRNISIYTQWLAARYTGKMDRDADEFISTVINSAKRMEMLIRDLLAYTRATRVDEDLANPIDANVVLKNVLTALAATIQESGASVTSGVLPTVQVHEIHLQQLFQNLIGNALKYRNEAPPRVQVSATRDGQRWVFSVKDNGIGIDPKYFKQIFGIFKRLHTAAEYAGTAIGLAMCQRIVERYGGRIWVESEAGQGANFYFTLPA